MTNSTQPGDFWERGLRRLVGRVQMDQDGYAPGLEGIVAAETAVSTINDQLEYRGYAIEELVGSSTFLEVAYLLMHGDLPDQEQFADFESIVMESFEIDPAIAPVLETLPLHVSGIQVLRTAVSLLGNLDPQLEESSETALTGKATRLLAQLPSVVAMRARIRTGLPELPPHPALSYVANLFYMVSGEEPTAVQEEVIEAVLMLNAEYGFNTSTFAARVVASCGTDLYGSVISALSTLDGDWAECPYEMIAGFLDRMQVDPRFEERLQRRFDKGMGIPGFRCSNTEESDSRTELLRELCQRVAAEVGQMDLELKAQEIEQEALGRLGCVPHSGWYTCRLVKYLGFSNDFAESLFVVGRMAGWIAHSLEQINNNCRIRPQACYVGPDRREFIPLSHRAGH